MIPQPSNTHNVSDPYKTCHRLNSSAFQLNQLDVEIKLMVGGLARPYLLLENVLSRADDNVSAGAKMCVNLDKDSDNNWENLMSN